MKKTLMIGLAALATLAGAQEMSLADASGKIGEAAGDPAVMSATVAQLSADDQVAYLAKVNEAIANMPGSPEEKAAAYLNANKAALRSAKPGNLAKLLAEVFATVPPEVLTVINESFANDLFNRASNPGLSDADFVSLVQSTMKTITARNASSDNAAVRDTFAALMFLRASNGSPADLAETLVGDLPADAQAVAKNEWIPAAMGIGQEQSYEPMLGAADAGEAVSPELIVRISGPQRTEALLSDLASVRTPVYDAVRVAAEYEGLTGSINIGSPDVLPRTTDPTVPWYPGIRRGESTGYDWQRL